MKGSARLRRDIVTLYLIVAAGILLLGQMSPASPSGDEGDLIFISDTDSIDAGRGSNSAYRIGLDGSGMKRIVGSIPHGDGYLRISDVDCHAASRSLVIASQRHDLNGFHHALLDGSKLHLDRPATGELLTSLRHIALGRRTASQSSFRVNSRNSRSRALAWSAVILPAASTAASSRRARKDRICRQIGPTMGGK